MSKLTIAFLNEEESDEYPAFERAIKDSMTSFGNVPLFTTDASGNDLYELYLEGLPANRRQHYNCNACKEFLRRYGGLVTINEAGEMLPVMWNVPVPPLFGLSASMIYDVVEGAKVTGVFLSEKAVLGTPITGEWTHLHAVQAMPFKSGLHKASEKMAEKKADYGLLKKSLAMYPVEIVNQALLLLRADSLYRSEKVLGVAEWFKDLHTTIAKHKNKKVRDNLVWRAVALAPPGYCHVGSTMIGTLLDDIVAGMDVDDISRRFATKMHPLQYQRPQADPSAGNIAKAEEIVAKLGIKDSLARRFAQLDELAWIWRPDDDPLDFDSREGAGVFAHLTPKSKASVAKLEVPTQKITWRKFLETVLPNAVSMDLMVNSLDAFCALVTAEHPDSPPIIQWDLENDRNPVSWYLYSGGSYATRWGLTPGWTQVNLICNKPSMWQDGFDHQGKGVIFILEGARDGNYANCGSALFPEILKSDLREVRSTIEAYSRKAVISGYEDSDACGIMLMDGNTVKVRVVTDLGTAIYMIDRLE